MIEPSQMKHWKIKCSVVSELSFAGIAGILPAVYPRPNDESLQAFLVLAQLDEIHICHLRGPRVVPTGGVVFRDIFVFREMVHDAGTGIFPEVVVIAVAHGFDQPGLIIGSKLQRRCSGAQRQRANVIADLVSHVNKGFGSGWIESSAFGGRQSIGSSSSIAQGKDPVEETQFEGSVVADTVTAV